MKFSLKSVKNFSVSVSILFHIVLVTALFFLNFTIDYTPEEYIELSFGTSGLPGSSGNAGTQINQVQELSNQQNNNNLENKTESVDNTKSTSTERTSDEDIVKAEKENKKTTSASNSVSNAKANSNGSREGQGNKGNGSGSFGYDIDWGGLGQRKIYSFSLPEYPEGVNKEIDIRLRFTILPDGTVGNIFPLIKADTRLENAAIHSLRQWRFEPLNPLQKQTEQVAVIVFPYRLK